MMLNHLMKKCSLNFTTEDSQFIGRCRFVDLTYTCEFRDQKFVNAHSRGLLCSIYHVGERNNANVSVVKFVNCDLSALSEKYRPVFLNAQRLVFVNSKASNMSRSHFKNYPKLTKVTFKNTKIPFLRSDLFADLAHLTTVKFMSDDIQLIGPNILDCVEHLSCVHYKNLRFSSEKKEKSNATLDEIKQALERDFSSSPWSELIGDCTKKLETKLTAVTLDKTLVDEFKTAMDDEELMDFTIVVDEERFTAHKFVLAARSPVFARMIKSDLEANELVLRDISPEVFGGIFSFIYTNTFPQLPNVDFKQILIASEKLGLKCLASYAADKLIDELSVDNAFELMTLSNQFGHKALRQRAYEEFKKVVEVSEEKSVEEKDF